MDDLNVPATKGDLLQATDNLKDELLGTIHELKDELTEAIRDSQTEVLRAFYSYAQSADRKMTGSEIADHRIEEPLSAAESRITEIERRLNLPPAA